MSNAIAQQALALSASASGALPSAMTVAQSQVSGLPAALAALQPGVTTLEAFGAVGDGTTNDQAAYTAAFAALAAGTYHTILLGAKTYLLGSGGNGSLPAGCSIVGQGNASILKTATNASIVKIVSAAKCSVRDFRIEGNSGSAAQIGIQAGDSAVALSLPVDLTVSGIYCYNLGWGFKFSSNLSAAQGPTVTDCKAEACAVGGFWFYLGEYTTLANCQANYNVGTGVIGVKVESGNIHWVGGSVNANTVGVQIDTTSNAAHGAFVGTLINHNGTPVRGAGVVSLPNGFKFVGCHMYGGTVYLTKCEGFHFADCTLDANDYIFEGSKNTVFENCLFATLTPSPFDSYLGNASTTTWRNCRRVADGRVVSWAEYGTATANKAIGEKYLPDSVQYIGTDAITITLPSPALWTGYSIRFKQKLTGSVSFILARFASESIEGVAANYTVSGALASVTVQSDGTNWWIVP